MVLKLEDLNPNFRQTTDLLLFSENPNLDKRLYFRLLKENYNSNLEYFNEQFINSSKIFWNNGFDLWCFRLNFILSLQDKGISSRVSSLIEKRMFNLTRKKTKISSKYDVEFIQYLAFCQIKKNKKENLLFAKNFLEDLSSHYRVESTIDVVKQCVPIVYDSLEDFGFDISKKINSLTRNLQILKALEHEGIKYNRESLIDLVNSIIVERINSDKNRRLLFELINDTEILAGLKEKYSGLHRAKILNIIKQSDLFLLEDKHLKNIKNLIELDSSLLHEIVEIYTNKLYSRQYSHKRSNSDRLVKLIKSIPQLSPKIVILILSSKNQMRDIKYLLSHFPEIKNLAIFI